MHHGEPLRRAFFYLGVTVVTASDYSDADYSDSHRDSLEKNIALLGTRFRRGPLALRRSVRCISISLTISPVGDGTVNHTA